jgi:hypothetical protein
MDPILVLIDDFRTENLLSMLQVSADISDIVVYISIGVSDRLTNLQANGLSDLITMSDIVVQKCLNMRYSDLDRCL